MSGPEDPGEGYRADRPEHRQRVQEILERECEKAGTTGSMKDRPASQFDALLSTLQERLRVAQGLQSQVSRLLVSVRGEVSIPSCEDAQEPSEKPQGHLPAFERALTGLGVVLDVLQHELTALEEQVG